MDEKTLSRLSDLAQICTITHVDGQRIPPARVLAWIENNLVRLGAEPSHKFDGEFTREGFNALDVHDLAGQTERREEQGHYADSRPGDDW